MTEQHDLVARLRDVGEIKDDDAYEGVDPRVVRALRGVSEVMKQAADRIETLESERREISMALGNQPDEPVTAAELVENIERISRIAGQGALKISALESRERVLREALGDLASWFTTPMIDGRVWLIPAGERGADDAVIAARRALAGDAP